MTVIPGSWQIAHRVALAPSIARSVAESLALLAFHPILRIPPHASIPVPRARDPVMTPQQSPGTAIRLVMPGDRKRTCNMSCMKRTSYSPLEVCATRRGPGFPPFRLPFGMRTCNAGCFRAGRAGLGCSPSLDCGAPTGTALVDVSPRLNCPRPSEVCPSLLPCRLFGGLQCASMARVVFSLPLCLRSVSPPALPDCALPPGGLRMAAAFADDEVDDGCTMLMDRREGDERFMSARSHGDVTRAFLLPRTLRTPPP